MELGRTNKIKNYYVDYTEDIEENEETIKHLIDTKKFLQENYYFFKNRKMNNTKILKKMKELIKFTDNKIRPECKHDYKEDYVEVYNGNTRNNENIKVCYCKLCWCTFPIK